MKPSGNTCLSMLMAACLLMFSLSARAFQERGGGNGDGARIAPPAALECERDDLTSYNGEVTAYQRDSALVKITISTDWGTSESLILQHDDPVDGFMLNGRAFTVDDWPAIEREEGVLREGTRAIAWICRGAESPPVIDWRPGSVPE